jgi:hypothetical protein
VVIEFFFHFLYGETVYLRGQSEDKANKPTSGASPRAFSGSRCQRNPSKNEGRASRKIIPDPGLRLSQLVSWASVARGHVRRSSCWRGGRSILRTPACQPRIERSDFKRHFVARGSDRDWSRLNHLCLVVPGIDLHASTERQSRDLIKFIVVERRTFARKSR